MSTEPQNPFAAPLVTEAAPLVDQPPATGELATRGERFRGAVIDALLVVPLLYGLSLAVGLGLAELDLSRLGDTQHALLDALLAILMWLVVFLAINGYLLATRGQTVGKWIMRTQIVSNHGTLVPFGPLLLWRYLPLLFVQMAPGIGQVFPLINVLAIFRANRKCLHDDIAGTKVIKIPPDGVAITRHMAS